MARGRTTSAGRAAAAPRPASMRDALSGRRSAPEPGALSPEEKRKRKEARIRKRVDDAHKRVAAGITALQDSDEFRAYLRTIARFHRYSFMNNLLIRSQRPDATMVASESAWKKLGRTLRTTDDAGDPLPRAERRPIHIFTPRTFVRKETDPETGEEKTIRMVNPRSFGTASVYDVTQTEGKPIAEAPRASTLKGESAEAEGMIQELATWCRGRNISFKAEPGVEGGGVYRDGAILIDSDLPHNQRGLLFARETARAALLAQGQLWTKLSPDERSLAVEGAAYAIASGFGLEAESATFPTMALVSTERRSLERALGAIQKATHAVLGGEPAPEPTE